MEREIKVYVDGAFYGRDEASVSVFDHGLLYGDGVFEGIRIYNGTVFRLKEHLERLYRSARYIMLEIPLSIQEMEEAVLRTVAENRRTDGYIRLVVTRGKGTLGIDPARCERPSVIIIVDDIQLYPPEYYTNGIAIVTASTRRLPPDGIDPRVKSLNYLNNILAKLEAKQAGCIEAVMLNRDGFAAECTADNLFIVSDGTLLTPQTVDGALGGITRSFVLELASSCGIPAGETRLSRYDLYGADECFLTGTGAEIVPVVSIDGRRIGTGKPGAVTAKLLEAFRAAV
jgi:branched-chain amino acid aminotransferase